MLQHIAQAKAVHAVRVQARVGYGETLKTVLGAVKVVEMQAETTEHASGAAHARGCQPVRSVHYAPVDGGNRDAEITYGT